jgi:hypothetical protein
MKKLTLAFLLFFSLAPCYGEAASEVNFKEGEIAFSLPDTWETKGSSSNRVAPKMDSSDPLYVAWKRTAIVDKGGNSVSAGLNITVFNVPPDSNVVLASSTLMRRRGWPFKEFLTSEKDGLTLPNSLGYLTEFSAPNGVALKVFVVHSINNGKFVEVTLSATDDIFSQVAPEFRAVLKSLRLATEVQSATPSPISLEEIDAVKNKVVALSSVEAIGTGTRILALAFSNAAIASFMRQLDAAGAVNVRIISINAMTACGRRINRAEFKIDGNIITTTASGQPLRIQGLDGKEFQCATPASL